MKNKDKKYLWIQAVAVILINSLIVCGLGVLLLWGLNAEITVKSILAIWIITFLIGKMDFIKLNVEKEIWK